MNVTHRLIATHDVIACTPICTPLSVRNGPSATTLDIVGMSSTKRRGSGTVELKGGWKFFYSGVDAATSA